MLGVGSAGGDDGLGSIGGGGGAGGGGRGWHELVASTTSSVSQVHAGAPSKAPCSRVHVDVAPHHPQPSELTHAHSVVAPRHEGPDSPISKQSNESSSGFWNAGMSARPGHSSCRSTHAPTPPAAAVTEWIERHGASQRSTSAAGSKLSRQVTVPLVVSPSPASTRIGSPSSAVTSTETSCVHSLTLPLTQTRGSERSGKRPAMRPPPGIASLTDVQLEKVRVSGWADGGSAEKIAAAWQMKRSSRPAGDLGVSRRPTALRWRATANRSQLATSTSPIPRRPPKSSRDGPPLTSSTHAPRATRTRSSPPSQSRSPSRPS